MILPRPARIAALSCYLILLAGCASFRTADRDLDAASRQLATASVKLSTADHATPQAEITPRGDFVVEGKHVDITPQQREEVLAYRAQYIDIAQQGIAIGHEGVDVGRRAVVPMVFAALFGASEKSIDASMDERLAGVRDATAKLCDRLPALRAAQQRLAADLPEFKPYATLTPKKIGECRNDAWKSIAVAQQ
jgi:hypothetical protein